MGDYGRKYANNHKQHTHIKWQTQSEQDQQKKLYIVFLDLHKKVSIFLNPYIITLEYNILETLKSFEYILSKILSFVEYCGKIIQARLETYIQLSKLERTFM